MLSVIGRPVRCVCVVHQAIQWILIPPYDLPFKWMLHPGVKQWPSLQWLHKDVMGRHIIPMTSYILARLVKRFPEVLIVDNTPWFCEHGPQLYVQLTDIHSSSWFSFYMHTFHCCSRTAAAIIPSAALPSDHWLWKYFRLRLVKRGLRHFGTIKVNNLTQRV